MTAKPLSDAERAKARGQASNAARTGKRRARRENPKGAKLVDDLTDADRNSKEARAQQAREAGKLGGRPKGAKDRSIWERLRERLARRVNDKLASPEWFDGLSEHTVTQLLKLVVPASRAVETGAGEAEVQQEGMQEVKIHLTVDEGPPRKSGDTEEAEDEAGAAPRPISVDEIIERLKGNRRMLVEVLRLCSAEDLLTAADGDWEGQVGQVIKAAAKKHLEDCQRMKQVREAEQASRRRARIFADPAAWTRVG